MKKLIYALLMLLCVTTASAQRNTDPLDRGLVAVPSMTTGSYLVSWRVLGEEYYDVTYNLYRDGALIASGLSASNYDDAQGTATSQYQVAAVVKGVEQEKCSAITPWNEGYKTIPMTAATDRDGNDASAYYSLNDVTLGDLNGDGVSEFIVKRPASDANNVGQRVRFNLLDCYDVNGNRLWWIDLGPNMIAGPDEQWDCVAYDWDQDGKAEVLLRCADDAIIHYKEGGVWKTITIGTAGIDTRYSGIQYTSRGNEYLLYLNGETGVPYKIGPAEHPDYMDYPLTRGSDGDWGYGINGHRSSKHYFGAPFLDGRKASIFLGRGAYSKHKFGAWDVDPQTHQLTQRWYWECDQKGDWFGQGYHNYAIGDVDWDGRDEIIFGSMVIDDNGKGLSTTGLGHGDSQHCADLDPFRKYEEQFACNEDMPAMNYRNATTGEIYYRITANDDDGRALMGNFTNDYPGSVGRTVNTGMLSSVADKEITELGGEGFISWADLNSRIYWDGDLLDEYMDSPGTNDYAVVYKAGTQARLLSAEGTSLTNSSKNNFCAQGDIFGDWREELVLRASDNNSLRIYTTPYYTQYRIPTLWSDHQYRNAMVWQSMGYNQTPHKSYFLGELEDITQAPPTNTMTGKTEIRNGGTVSSDDKHFIVCETGNTSVSIPQGGASPYIMEFNVPSWVQGTAESNSTQKGTPITYTYYTCDVTGGALTGATRLVKTGDGILNLPAVTMTHTGNTDIWGGTVNFNGTMQNSPIWMNRHTTLNTTSGSFSSLKMEYGSTLDITTAATVGTLELHEGARVKIDLDSNEKINITDLMLRNQGWKYGPKYLAPVFEITSASKLQEGTKYEIGTISGTVTGIVDKVVVEGNVDMGQQANLSVENGKLYVSVSYDESLCKPTTITLYERGVSTAWSAADVASSGSNVGKWVGQFGYNETYKLYKADTGSRSSNITINTNDSRTLTYDIVFDNLNNTGASGNYSYLKIGSAIEIRSDQQNQNGKVIINGTEYSITDCNQKYYNRGGDKWTIHAEIDTKTNELTAFTLIGDEKYFVNGTNVNTSSVKHASFSLSETKYLGASATCNNLQIGFVRVSGGGSPSVALTSIEVKGSTYSYAGAQYQVRYVDETGATVKPIVTRMGIIGNTVELEADDTKDVITADEAYQYVYVSNNASAIAENGSTVVTVTFNKKFKYTVKAVDAANTSNVIKTIATGYVDDSENLTVYYDHGIEMDGRYYFINANNASPLYGTTASKSSPNKSLAYTYNPDVAYYSEAEDMVLTRTYDVNKNNEYVPNTNPVCSGNIAIGVYDQARIYGSAVPAGRYILTVRGIVRNAKDAAYTVRTSLDNENFTNKGTITFKSGATGEQTLTNIDMNENEFIDLLNGAGNANNRLDYVMLTRQKANYTVKFVDQNGTTLKADATRQGYIAAALSPSDEDMEDIISGSETYNYMGFTLASGTTVLANGTQVMTVRYKKYAPATSKVIWNFTKYTEQVSPNNIMEYSGMTLVGNNGNANDYVSTTAGFHMNGASSSTTRYIKFIPKYDGKLTVWYRSNNKDANDRITAIGTSIITGTDVTTLRENANVLAAGLTQGSTQQTISANLTAGTTYYVYFANGGQSIMKLEYSHEVKDEANVTATVAAGRTFGTFSSVYNVDFSDTNETDLIAAYTVKYNGNNSVTLNRHRDILPAGHGVVLYAPEATKSWTFNTVAETSATVADNDMVGVPVATWVEKSVGEKYNYVMSANQFHPLSESGTIAAGKAYLSIACNPSSNAKGITLCFGEDATGINEKNEMKSLFGSGKIYNMQGQEVKKPQPGRVYIIDGMKILFQ